MDKANRKRLVACDGFEALMRGEERVVSASLSIEAQGRGSRLLPDRDQGEGAPPHG